MTDYNDGNWHEWNGGECPVHPKSEIEGYWQVEDAYPNKVSKYAVYNAGRAGGLNFKWDGQTRLHLFRVTKPYIEPREFWINEYPGCFGTPYSSKAEADEGGGGIRIRCIHVREVIEK